MRYVEEEPLKLWSLWDKTRDTPLIFFPYIHISSNILNMNRPLKADDIGRLTLVSDPKISPAGDKFVFTVTKPDLQEDKYISNLWLYDFKEKTYTQLTSGGSDHSPEWSPDGKHISFISRRTLGKDERGNELWILDLKRGCEPRLLLKSEGGVSNVRWSPDGKYMIYISQVGKIDEDVKVIESIPIWFNGRGFIYNLYSHLFLLDVASGNIRQLTNGSRDVQYAEWSPDGRYIAYIVNEDRMKPYINEIYLYDVKSGEANKLTKGDMVIWDLAWDPTGKYIVFRGHKLERGLSTHLKLWILSIETNDIKILLDLDRQLSNTMNSDVRGPSSARYLQWIGDYIYFPVAISGYTHLYRVDINGAYSPVVDGELVVENFSIHRDIIVLTLMTSVSPPEAYLFHNKTLERLTSFNDFLLEEVSLVRHEKFSFKASDGVEIEGWILKPYGFKENRRYPAILYIHGGPSTSYGEGFIHEFHVLSGEGYVIIYTNPRGSTGYSQDFRDIRGRYGDRDYKDLMEALEYVIRNYDFIDPKRLGVAGGSYGGFMTNWIIGHTNRFKAAVTQRSISNWISDYGTTDIGFYFNEDQIAGELGRPYWIRKWFKKYWDHSPLKYVNRVKTPLLIIHSLEDYRCWLDQALQIFTALKVRGIPARLVLFPGENHDLSRKGKPKHRVKRLEEIINWFNKYLKNKRIK